jgi:hypothetical protein
MTYKSTNGASFSHPIRSKAPLQSTFLPKEYQMRLFTGTCVLICGSQTDSYAAVLFLLNRYKYPGMNVLASKDIP